MTKLLDDIISYTFMYGSNCATHKIEINPHYKDVILFKVEGEENVDDTVSQRTRIFNASPDSIILNEIDGSGNLVFTSTWTSYLYDEPIVFNHMTLNEVVYQLLNRGLVTWVDYDDIKLVLSMIISCFVDNGYTEALGV